MNAHPDRSATAAAVCKTAIINPAIALPPKTKPATIRQETAMIQGLVICGVI
jgi:hypothetical protein